MEKKARHAIHSSPDSLGECPAYCSVVEIQGTVTLICNGTPKGGRGCLMFFSPPPRSGISGLSFDSTLLYLLSCSSA